MTSVKFRARIRTSIANESLQAALDANAARRVQGRAAAFASLPDWKERRRRAHAVRADVIANLDDYLDRFITRVTGNGIHVHRARGAADAIKAVLNIVEDSLQRRAEFGEINGAIRENPSSPRSSVSHALIAKSKSMVSEELELNRALEAHGHRVVETDLGEYIVQLRGEKPAHIITPAVHLRRHEVGRLFEEKLGLPYTEDIPTLTAAARKTLRQVFLTADVGISGVNFGVAETGTLCIVTNEGNGRMVATLPPVHIALMGMERLVPTLDDLALMLSLLPRSATGQKLSVYTQLIRSPRRAGEMDGARERHLVIVDNGRSRLRSSSLREALYCIRCGACLNACPVFREIGGHAYVGSDGSIAPYPGPIGSIVSPGLLGLAQFGHLAQASSLCGACKDACPVDIDLPKLLTRVRAGENNAEKKKAATGLSSFSKFGLQLYGVLGSSPRLFSLAQKISGIGAWAISPFSNWFWLPAFTGWGFSKDFPRPAARPFRARFRGEDTPRVPPQGRSSQIGRAGNTSISGAMREENGMESSETRADDTTERFVQELEALGGQAYRIHQSELNERLIDFMTERGIDAVLSWHPVEGLDEDRLMKAGVRTERIPDPALRAGITGAALAIAETGTLVLPSGKGRPLSASLSPEIHIAIIKSSQIVRSLEEALQTKELQEASAVALITGPSRTADIEMTLTIGVHGPRELIVYIAE